MRPQKDRFVKFDPSTTYFKPQGIPLYELKEKNLTVDEIEAIRLCDFLGKSQEEAGKSMKVSRATLGRIVQKARAKIAEALIFGKAIKIEGGKYQIPNEHHMYCKKCPHYNNRGTDEKDFKCPEEIRKSKKCCEFRS